MTHIYKLVSRSDWQVALASGQFEGSAADLADGYIHFSTADQAQETAERHFQSVDELLLLTVDDRTLGETLKWESARGGQLFPHLYGPLDHRLVIDCRAAPLGEDGTRILGDLGL